MTYLIERTRHGYVSLINAETGNIMEIKLARSSRDEFVWIG